MPDYDPKSIPILDDIIEGEADDDKADAAETDDDKIISDQINADLSGTENIRDDDTLDLFNGGATDIEADSIEPEDAVVDDFFAGLEDDNDAAETLNSETEITESALIDYQAEDGVIQDDVSTFDDQARQQTIASDPSITLNSIVDDVVKQLVPDLEQQLRFLVKQALEEKLPEDVIRKMSIETSSENDE